MPHPSASEEPAVFAEVHDFLQRSHFMERGAVITDLDGTAVHEVDGRVHIPREVEYGLKRMHDRGRSVIINTMRFPRSVLDAFALEWFRITGAPIPLVALNGSQIGYLVSGPGGTMMFEQVASFTLTPGELDELLVGIEAMVQRRAADDLLVFFYPRDWRIAEVIYTPERSRLAATMDKYRSAHEVFSGPVQALRERLMSTEVCLVFVLNDVPEDRRMAYQHTERTRFVTHEGVDKRHGALQIARHLGIELEHSVGAGDAETDNFLSVVGLAAIVGNANLDFKGLHATLRLPDPLAWGRVLYELGQGVSRSR
jgi:hydroxymethylpyrimidine pyrophosphatase-like HAD family hydrolase